MNSRPPTVCFCMFHRPNLPSAYPAQPRQNMTLHRPEVVAERNGECLLCSNDHPGLHLWPDGEEVGTWPESDESPTDR